MRTTVVELFVVPRSRSELLEHQGTLGTRGIDIREGQAYGFRRGVMVPTLKLAIPISQIVIPSARHGEHVPGHHRLLAANLADDVGRAAPPRGEHLNVLPLEWQVAERDPVDVEVPHAPKIKEHLLAIRTLKANRADPLREHTDVQHYPVLPRQEDSSVHGSQCPLVEHRVDPDPHNAVS